MNIAEQQEKTTKQLQADGFEVLRQVPGASGVQYDLVARRDGRTIVFEFKNQSQLNSNLDQISRLRQSAREDGYFDFRLVVVPEGEPSLIQIQGLDEALLTWLQNHPEIKKNTVLEDATVFFKRVGQVSISSIGTEAKAGHLNAKGVAVTEFTISYEKATPVWDCPIYFEAELETNGRFKDLNAIIFDISSIAEDLEENLLPSYVNEGT